MPTSLVCGGAGYIGSHMVRSLLEEGERVVVLDNLSTGRRDFVPAEALFIQGDVRDGELLDRLLPQHDVNAVFLFASLIKVGESVSLPLAYYENNFVGALRVVESMVRSRTPHFIFSSSAAVYGEPEAVPITEDMPLRPTNPYGETKLAVEQMLRWASEAHGFTYGALRYFNACGAIEDATLGEVQEPETHLIPLVLDAAIGEKESISVFGDDYDTPDGTCVRDYIHVMDLARAHLLTLDALRRGGGSKIYNLGNGRGFSVEEVIDACRSVTGLPIKVVRAPRRAGDPARLIASSDRARQELGWTPHYLSLESIVETSWRWHRKRRGGRTA